MNARNIFKIGALVFVLSLLVSAMTFAQTTRYVNNTNGDDFLFPGTQVQPYKTIAKAISVANDGDIISIASDTYNEGTVGITKNVTLVSTSFNGLSTATITNGVTVNITTGAKVAYLGRSADGSQKFNFGSSISALTLTSGTLNIDGANVIIEDGATITRSAGAINATPTTGDIKVVYSPAGDLTAGPELPADIKSGSIIVNVVASKTVTFPAALTVGANGFIQNAGAGSVVFSGNVAFVGGSYAASVMVNGANGNMSFTLPVSFAPTAATTTVLANNGTGTLALNGGSTKNGSATIAVTNASTGTVTLAGGNYNGTITNNNGGTINIAAATEFSGAVISNNNAASKIKLSGNQLTVSGAATLTNIGAIYSNTVATIGTGVLNITGTVVTAGAGEYPNVTVSGTGTLTLGGTMTMFGDYNQSSAAAGALTFGANTLDVKGNFYRSSNDPADVAWGTGTLQFTGTGSKTFVPGASMTVYNLVVNKTGTGDVLSMGQALIVANNVTITAGALNLGDNNLRLGGNPSTFTNAGNFYSSTGNGYLIFEGASGVISGAAGTWGNMDVRVGAGNSVTAATAINFSGNLVLRSGTLAMGANTMTLTSTNVVRPKISVLAGAITPVGGLTVNAVAPATFYDLEYLGSVNYAGAAEWLAGTGLYNISINTTGATTVAAPAGATNFAGALTVAAGQTLALGGVTTATGNNMMHQITGAVTGNTLVVSGSGVINGSTVAADAASVAGLAFEPAADNASLTVSNIKAVTGNVTIEGASTKTGTSATLGITAIGGNLVIGNGANAATVVATIGNATAGNNLTGNLVLTNGALTLTMGSAAVVGGSATYTAGSLTLGSNLTVNGATSFNGADINLGAYNYKDMSGTVSRVNGGFTATTGKLQFGAAATGFTPFAAPGTSFTVPNLENITGTTTVAGPFTVSTGLTLTAGTLAMGANDLTITGSTVAANGGALTGTTGKVIFTGTTTVTSTGAFALQNVVLNTTGAVTLASNNTTARTFTFTTLTQTAGDLGLGINSLVLNGGASSFTRVAGNMTMTTGKLVLNNAALTFDPGTGFAVDNLEVQANAATTGTQSITVNKYLTLTGGALTLTAATDGKLVLGAGATIERNAGTLANIPTFGTTVNVTYTGAVTTAKELPTASSVLATLLIKNNVSLPVNAQVNSVLDLNTGTLTVATTKTLTLANGALMRVNATVGSLALAGTGAIAKPNYNLEYYGAGTVTADASNEFTSSATAVNNVTLNGTTTVLLNANKTINGTLTVNSTGGIQLFVDPVGYTLTVKGDVAFVGAGLVAPAVRTAAGSMPALVFAGTARQTFTVPSAGYAFTNATDVATANKIYNENGEVPPTNLTINNAKGVVLAGGNLTMGFAGVVNFVNGELNTATNSKVLTLWHSSSPSNQPVQGFDRSGIAAGTYSHVVGSVRKFIDRTDAVAITRVEFPVGTADGTNGYYRPYAAFFKTQPQSSVNLTVSHVDARPVGFNGFPVAADNNMLITNYPNFYWYVKSDMTLQPSYAYDMEAQAQGYADYVRDAIENVRFVRRDSGNVNNFWIMQKNVQTNSVNYDNSTIAQDWPVVKVFDATGGITTQGSIFTYSQTNKPPMFLAPTPGNVTKNEGDTLKVTFAAADPDINQTATLSTVSIPTGATFNATTGLLTWVIGYDQAGTKTITVRATDNSGLASGTTRDTSIVVTVVNVNRAPQFVNKLANVTVKDSTNAVNFTYTASDIDNETFTFALAAGSPAGMSLTPAGVLTWTPTFAQSSKTGVAYTVKVYVTDVNGAKDSTTATVTVVRRRAKGDINGDVIVGTADATIALQAAVGTKTFAMPADTIDFWAGDVTGNGTVSALDASYILRKVAGDTVTFAPKMAKAYNGTVEFGKAVSASNGVTIPVKVANAENVTAVTFTVNVDSKVAKLEGVKTTLPKDWTYATSENNGVVTVAMAGITPINSGDVATIGITLKEKEASISVNGNGFVNEADAQSLSLENVRMMPSEFALEQNYPNPFNPSTTIKYQLTEDSKVNLTIYNLQGQVVRTLVNDNVAAGFQSVTWNGRNEMGQQVASGMYMYRIQAGSFVSVKKMLMLK